MAQQLELFIKTDKDKHNMSNTQTNSLPSQWYFVTNHQNLLMYLAMNIIHTGFVGEKKYYKDSLEDYPGWIPIFGTVVPQWARDNSTEENKILEPVLLEINLTDYVGNIWIYSTVEAQWLSTSIEQLQNEKYRANFDTRLVLIPSTLATGLIKSIKLPNDETKKKIVDKAKDTNGVDLALYKILTSKQLFKPSKNKLEKSPKSVTTINYKPLPIDYPLTNSFAAIYALLSVLGNVNEPALQTLLTLLKHPISEESNDNSENEPNAPLNDILANFCSWALNPTTLIKDSASAIFIEVLEIIIRSSNSASSKSTIITILENKASDENSKQFVKDLSSMGGLGNKSFDDLMVNYSARPLNRLLISFFYSDDLERFFEVETTKLSEIEIVLTAIMVAANCGWLKLPDWIKNYANMSKAMSLLMADFMQPVISESNEIALGSIDVKAKQYVDFPLPVRHHLKLAWHKKQQEAAKLLIQENDWDCIDCEVSFPNGSYNFETTARFLKVKSKAKIIVKEIIDQENFLNLIKSLKYINPTTEKSMRSKL